MEALNRCAKIDMRISVAAKNSIQDSLACSGVAFCARYLITWQILSISQMGLCQKKGLLFTAYVFSFEKSFSGTSENYEVNLN